jgi:hypothetical protein
MRRLGFSLLVLLLLAACSSAPQRISRSPSGYSQSASNDAYRTAPPGFPNFVDHSIGREEISIQAMSLVGIPYRWGGNTPDSGFDCSGLVRYVVERAASVNLPRTTADMSERGESIEPDDVAPGDLIFFNTTGRPHSHVGIYVGKLRFVNAPSTGGTVRIDYLTNPYWAKRFDGIRRVAAPLQAPAPFDTPTYQASAPPVQAVPAVAQVPLTAATRAAPTAPTAPADAFEPPPPVMSAAQMQAREAGAVAPSTVPTERVPAGRAPYDAGATVVTSGDASAQGTAPPDIARSPDPIDAAAAADAFEPPPSTPVAVRQERQAGSASGVQIMRASTASHGVPAPTQSGDDPIAHFANGSD